MRTNFVVFMLLLAGGSTSLFSQLIPLKSIPVPSGNQFSLVPSHYAAMGGVSLAVEDPLGDPFRNPGRGRAFEGYRFFSAPTFFNITNQNGAGRSIPLGIMRGDDSWFGGLMFAGQQLSDPEWRGVFPLIEPGFQWIPPNNQLLRDRHSENYYLSAFSGWRPPDSGAGIGIGLNYAALDELEGVDMLYANSSSVVQSGYIADVRVGVSFLNKRQQSLDITAVHHRVDMEHEVDYSFWGDERRLETHLDKTNTWGLETAYQQPLGTDGWRLGANLTVNRKSHPKIPNYEIMNIPRDPGNTWAFSGGLGVSRQTGPATFAAELLLQPMWSHTWADAAGPVQTASGATIPAGGITVDNKFDFINWIFRSGIGRQGKMVGFQLGLELYRIHYWLDQEHFVDEFKREQEEKWLEWTPTFGLNVNLPEFTIRYIGSVTGGTGQPGIMAQLDVQSTAFAENFIVAPGGSLTLQESKVIRHQLVLDIPLR